MPTGTESITGSVVKALNEDQNWASLVPGKAHLDEVFEGKNFPFVCIKFVRETPYHNSETKRTGRYHAALKFNIVGWGKSAEAAEAVVNRTRAVFFQGPSRFTTSPFLLRPVFGGKVAIQKSRRRGPTGEDVFSYAEAVDFHALRTLF